MDERARLRVNLANREFEVEGSEAFVREQSERLEALLQAFEPADLPIADLAEPVAPPAVPAAKPAALGEFGDFILRLPSSATDVDRMLASGFYVQSQSDDDAFGTSDANRRLVEQGVKLGNPSQCVRQSLIAKRVFLVKRGRFRVSQIGRQHLRQLMGPLVPE